MKVTLNFVRDHKRFLAFGFLMTFFSSYGQSFFFGLYNKDIRLAYDLTNTEFGGIYGIVTLTGAFLITICGRLLDRAHLPYYALTVLSAVAIGCFIMGTASSFPLFILALFLIRFAGQGLLGHTATTSMTRYFDETRGRAISISRFGFHFGEILFPFIVIALIAALGWKLSWLALGGVLVVFVIPAILWLLNDHRDRHNGWLQDQDQKDKDAEKLGEIIKPFKNNDLFMDWRFYAIMPSILINPIIGTGVFFYIENFSTAKGWDETFLAKSIGLQAATIIIFSFIVGLLVDRYGSKRLMPLMPIPTALSLVVFTFVGHPIAAPLFMILFGMTSGFLSALGSSIWAELYGTRNIGAIKGITMMIMVFSTAIAPPIMGYLFDQNIPVEWITGTLLGVTIFAAIATLPLLRDNQLHKTVPAK